MTIERHSYLHEYHIDTALSLMGPADFGGMEPRNCLESLALVIKRIAVFIFRLCNYLCGDHLWYTNETARRILEELSYVPLNHSPFRAQAEILYDHLQYRANGNVSCVEGIRLMYEQPAPPPPNPANTTFQQPLPAPERQNALEVPAPFDLPEDADHSEDTEEHTSSIAPNLPHLSGHLEEHQSIQIIPPTAAPPAEHEDECAICLEENLPNPVQLGCSCKHVLDLHCIFEWYLKDKTCPMARCPITEIHSLQKISADLITLNLIFSNALPVKLSARPDMTIRHLKTLLKTINVQIFANSEKPIYLDNNILGKLPSASKVKAIPGFYFVHTYEHLTHSERKYLPGKSTLAQLDFTPSNTYNIEVFNNEL
jgi:hypothetical protein